MQNTLLIFQRRRGEKKFCLRTHATGYNQHEKSYVLTVCNGVRVVAPCTTVTVQHMSRRLIASPDNCADTAM